MALITVTEAADETPQPTDRKIVINSSQIVRIEPANPATVGNSTIYMRDGTLLQVRETQQQIIELAT